VGMTTLTKGEVLGDARIQATLFITTPRITAQ